ncbi:probable phospholipase A1 magnifin [Drosophila pseudoobscura]|uniref:Probable phospholipase A1 magnifin n=1 Tax=Drosophila pseudoobscura pseudoobscura TaxID=46245 RepID=A0A6I8UFC0_DROPS|nr:probable phospholipase A1 magnifin [Drosophila pseudoobscura]
MTPFTPVLLLLALGLAGSSESETQKGLDLGARLEQLQDTLQQVFVGLPLGITFSQLNKLCSTIVDLGLVQTKIIPDMSRMSFLLRTDECQNVSIPLTEAEKLWEAPGFYQDRPTVIFITGWRTSITDSNSGPAAKAYNCRNDTNFVLLDAADFIDTLYSWSALNTEAIGAYVAEALLKLDRSYVIQKVHLVGHSLGAQIAGSAGRNFKKLSEGATLARVTGLDPANPCFYDGNNLGGVRSGDAEFVDIIHTNPGVLGTPKVVGDADFYVEGLFAFKSGCGASVSCSHDRAVKYYSETVYRTNTNNFLGKSCGRYADLWDGRNCNDTRAVMGYGASARDQGFFYVDANDEEPFGTNANPEAYTASNSQCGAC